MGRTRPIPLIITQRACSNCFLPSLFQSPHISRPQAIPPLRHSLKPDPSSKLLHPPIIQPLLQILALADIKIPKLVASVHNSVYTRARDTHAAAHGELVEFEEMQTDASEGGVGDGAATEGEVEFAEVGAAEGEDLGGGVGECAAEGLYKKRGGWLNKRGFGDCKRGKEGRTPKRERAKYRGMEAHQIKISKSLCCVGEVYYSVIRQICTVGQT